MSTTPDVYVTTAIPYVNADPHLGHALELVAADVLARHHRSRGRGVRFLTGTDDHAVKNVAAARRAGQETAVFVAEHARRFDDLTRLLDVAVDDVIHTATDVRHRPGVERLWRACAARGDFYRESYTGLYCPGCEQFYATTELVDRRCGEHGDVIEEVTESNWFFRLGRYAEEIANLIEAEQVRVVPAVRRNEVLAFLRSEVRDLSVSRPATRSGGWGIPVPGDLEQVVYVWWDALGNYVTALGDPGDEPYERWWRSSAERVHVIGKGITRFHAVYWLALLLSAGEPLPTTIAVHDYLSLDGAKISKSVGAAVSPADVIATIGLDALRWWFAADVAPVGDTDFSLDRARLRYTEDLTNGLGNLVQRTLVLAQRCGRVAGDPLPIALRLPVTIDTALAAFDLRRAAAAINDVVRTANAHLNEHAPWRLSPTEAAPVVATTIATCHLLAGELEPFLPRATADLRTQLVTGTPSPLFPRLTPSP